MMVFLSTCLFNMFGIFVLQIHESRQGQAFKTQVQKMRIEILQSPWLCELMAFHINLKESKKESGATITSPPPPVHALFDGCALTFDDGKPLLSCELSDSVKVDIDLTCSICLVRNLRRISM
jgi:E3 ubiquitin-protein ligase BAH